VDKLLVGGAVEKVVPLCAWKIEHLVLELWKAGRWTLRLAVGDDSCGHQFNGLWFTKNKSCGAEARSRDFSDTLTRGFSNESSVN